MISSGGLTDRLARAGLVRRGQDPADRRSLLAELTPQVAAVAEAAFR